MRIPTLNSDGTYIPAQGHKERILNRLHILILQRAQSETCSQHHRAKHAASQSQEFMDKYLQKEVSLERLIGSLH